MGGMSISDAKILLIVSPVQSQSTPNFKTPNSSFKENGNGRKSMNSDEKRGVERFRRIKEEEVEIDTRVVDNSFEAKVSVLN